MCTLGLSFKSEIPQLQFKTCVSPPQAQILQAGWMGLDVLDAVLFNVLSKCVRPHRPQLLPGAKLYAQTVTAAIFDCESHQPIVSTISCSLLIWKEPGLMIASAISQLWAALFARAIVHPQTLECAKVVHALWAPSMQPDVHSLVSVLSMMACLLKQFGSCSLREGRYHD